MNRFGKKSAVKLIVLAAILLVSAVAFATSGVASSDNGATGRAAAEPLGNLSASPPGDQSEVLGQTGGGGNGSDGGGGGSAGASGSGGGGSSRLPFTGFVAIPLLLAGAGLLTFGVGIRRRAARAVAS